MITTYEEYNKNLHLINNDNPPAYAALPSAENIYNIDLNSREIDAPKYLAVEKDHHAETVYFIVDRFFDYMDLSTTNCIITYTNALGKSKMYTVPFYDIYTYVKDKKMIIPWVLDADVGAAAGAVEFYLQFYSIDWVYNEDAREYEKQVVYSLNTLSAKSNVLSGMEVGELDSSYLLNASQYEELSAAIKQVSEATKAGVYWTILD